MAAEFDFKDRYDIADLLRIMTILRMPEGGCPWDAAQTHKSIRRDFIEETYEAVEAINKDDPVLLQEELGDVLMQVVFHAEIEREAGRFSFDDVADGICKKLIERHPHVFGSVRVEGTEDVLTNWDAIKRASKKQKTYASAMDAVPRELPALMRAEKIHHKAAKSGLVEKSVNLLVDSVLDHADALRSAVAGGEGDLGEILGRLLFDAAGLADLMKLDPELALTNVTDEYIEGFRAIESSSLEEEADELWAAALDRNGT